MDAGMCERHTGGQPGGAGGVCAICLQEKLLLLWRGEGYSHWDTEEFSVTPPLEMPPPGDSPEPPPAVAAAASACFPLLLRARNLQREKIDRSDDRERFSCEIKSLVKELVALHEKKRVVKTKRPTCEGVAADVSQGSGMRDTDAAPQVDAPKVAGSALEEDGDEDAKDTKATLCFNTLWPAKLNLKWAKFLVSPNLSSNKIAPSKSDLLAKIVNARPKAPTVEEAPEDRETSGAVQVNNDVSDTTQVIETCPAVALLPSRYVQHAAAEDQDAGAVSKIDKETAMRMEASRITVMTWLQSLPSPKAVHLKGDGHSGRLDDLGMLEMCDEEVMELDCQSQQMETHKFECAADGEQVDQLYSHMTSFGKFLQTPSPGYVPARLVDIEIAAQ